MQQPIVRFLCPNERCRKPLGPVGGRIKDLFCRSCGVTVAVFDDGSAMFMASDATELSVRCILSVFAAAESAESKVNKDSWGSIV
jgi:hypothetical protein